MDVTMDVRDTQQHSNNDTRTFRTFTRREALTVRQLTELASLVMLETRVRTLRETAGGDATGVDLESEQKTLQPDVIASFRRKDFHIGTKANWLRRQVAGTSGLAPESTRRQFGGWLDTDIGESTRLSASVASTATEEEGGADGDRTLRQRTGYLNAERSLGRQWTMDYILNGISSDVVTRGSRREEWSHALDLVGTPQVVSDRLATYFRTRSQFLRQDVEVDPVEGPSILRRPLSGAVILDDTPDVQDPLEDDGVSVPELFDRDLETPTSINLGDSAPVVLEFGGDYRNIRYDFGGTEEPASAVLYVDERLLNPELVRWTVFVTDDPEGRIWEEVDAGRVSVAYREFGTVLQGWEFVFEPGVAGRYVKLVNAKLGPTGPNLFVTELEVLVRDVREGRESRESSRLHEAQTRLDYAVTPEWDVGYSGSVEARRFSGDARNTDQWNHGVRTAYTLEGARLHASWDTHTVTQDGIRDTDVDTYRLWATRIRNRTLSGTLSWSRTVDGSGDRDRTTDSYSVSGTWRAAPRLRFHYGASHGRRRDDLLDTASRSWALTNRIESSPFRTVSVDLRHTERWVSSEAGAGFERFRDFRAEASWSPAPLISFSNTTRYLLRQSEQWDTRQSMTWSPLRGGAIEPRFSADAFHDSRVDTWELGARMAARWRMRPGLLAEGSLESRRFEIAGVETTPVNTEVHVSWSF
jgi:hypothetical protein